MADFEPMLPLPGGPPTPEGAVPALLLERPVFPGQTLDLPLNWSWEHQALARAMQTDGFVTLVPLRHSLERVAVEVKAVGVLATIAQVLGSTPAGIVRVRGLTRVRVTWLDLPPAVPMAGGEELEGTEIIDGSLDDLAHEVRQLAPRWLDAQGHNDMPFWTADPGRLGDLLAPLILKPTDDSLWQAYQGEAKTRLSLVRDALQAQLSEMAGPSRDEQTLRAFTPPPSLADIAMADIRRRFRGAKLDKASWAQISRRVRIAAESKDTSGDLEYIRSLPLGKYRRPNADLERARRILLRGLGDLDDPIAKWVLARVAIAGGPDPAPPSRPLLMAGRPGIGKTHRAEVLARALGLDHQRLGLAGLSEAHSIRGTRAIFDRAQPGLIVQALTAAGSSNPVIVLDEIDKLGGNDGRNGDPAESLLAVLDPLQERWTDDFCEFPISLQHVTWVATANDPERVSPVLRDRFELLELPAYTPVQRRNLTQRVLLPRLRSEYGLGARELRLKPSGLEEILRRHAADDGLRQLENSLRSICVLAAERRALGQPAPAIDAAVVSDLLGAGPGPEEDLDTCLICGEPVEADGELVRLTANELAVLGPVLPIPITLHRFCLLRPTSYLLRRMNVIHARYAAEAVVWMWMTRTPQDLQDPDAPSRVTL